MQGMTLIWNHSLVSRYDLLKDLILKALDNYVEMLKSWMIWLIFFLPKMLPGSILDIEENTVDIVRLEADERVKRPLNTK